MAWANTHKHVPTILREACLARDDNQCTATMRDGTRCKETRRLEADHIHGWQPGEQLTLDMLQTLCWWHHNKKTQEEAAAARKRNPVPRNRRRVQHPGLL